SGLLRPQDWVARWIEPGYSENMDTRPSPLFRKTFSVTKKIQSANLYVTSHGLYEAKINGQRIGNAYLSPGWTSYKKRLAYQAYDLTDQIRPGANSLGVMLGNGWYRG